jgi:glucan 1,3-beta-glucosidase
MRTIHRLPLSLLLLIAVVLLVALVLVVVVEAVPVQLYGLNYNTRKGADWNPNKCKSREEVVRDLSLLSRITNRFRLLSLTDCGQAHIVLDVVARELAGGNLQVFLGLWVSDDEAVFLYELQTLKDMIDEGLINDNGMVLGISVGSESIYREEVTAAQIVDYTVQVKQVLIDNGLSALPVAICDIAPTFQYNTGLISASDVVMTNSFPFWEGVNINRAIDRLETQISPIIKFAATENKTVILGETGWPSAGFIPGVGMAGPALQAQYFTEFFCRMDRELDWQYYYFTGIDNGWRQEQDKNNTIEGNWGFLYANMTLKPHYQNLIFTCPNSLTPNVAYTLSEIDWTVPTVVAPPTISPAPIAAEACQAHAACRDAGLFGNCCPGSNGMVLECCDSDIIGGDDQSTASPSTAATDTDLPTGPPITTPGSSSPNITEFPTTAPEASSTARPTTSPPILTTSTPSMAPSASSSSMAPTASPSSVDSNSNNTDPISNSTNSTTVPATTTAPDGAISVSPSMTPTVSPLNNNNNNSTAATEEPTSADAPTTTPLNNDTSAAPSSMPSALFTLFPEESTATLQPITSSSSMLLTANAAAAARILAEMMLLAAPLLLLL